MTTERKDDFGFCRNAGPADGLHEIASIMTFMEYVLIAEDNSKHGSMDEFEGVLEGFIQLTNACRIEIKRIADVCPVSVERDTLQAAE